MRSDEIKKGSDKKIDLQLTLDVGTFKFSDYDRIRLIVYDIYNEEIQKFAYPDENGYSTLRPVLRSENETTGNYEYTTDSDQNIGQISLLGSNTIGKGTGMMRFEYHFRVADEYFEDDNNDDDIIDFYYYKLID